MGTWDGDGLPADDTELSDILTGDLGCTLPELHAMVNECKSQAWIHEKTANYAKDKKSEWYLDVARYYWRRHERLRVLVKQIEADVDEELDLTDNLIANIGNETNKRNDIAREYAEVLKSRHSDYIDWLKINQAIVDRWSPSALGYIKQQAWKIVDEFDESQLH